MPNKKVIRISDKKEGTFTTVSYTILHNPNLKPVDKMLLISILSDSDSFQLNQNLYANRLGVSRKTINESIQRLVIQGYLKEPNKKSKGKGNGFITYYTISEYGNLNNQTKVDDIEIEVPTKIELTEPTVNFDEAKVIIANVIDKVFPSMPDDVFLKYLNDIKDAVVSGQIDSMKVFNESAIVKSISKIYTEPALTKMSIVECENIIKNKMTGGTINQRADTVKKVKQWFMDNGCVATEDEIKDKTFKTHSDSKTAGRVLDQRYQD